MITEQIVCETGKLTRLAIVGYGLIGQRHAEVIQSVSGIILVAVVEPEGSISRRSIEPSVPLFSDIDQMLEQANPDGVIIASPTTLHILHAKSCIQKNVPMLIEKPISDDLIAARELTLEAAEKKVALLVGHHRRFNPIIKRSQELIRSGEIGEVRAINAICWFYKPDHYFETAPWRKISGAGPISVNLIHDIDLLRYFCGEVIAVQAQCTSSKRGYENEDLGSAILRFANGAIGTVTVSDSIASPWSWEFTSNENPVYPSTQQSTYFIGGSKGSISIPDMTVWRHEGGQDWWNPMTSEFSRVENIDPLINQIIHFNAVIQGLEPPLVSGFEGVKSLEVIDAIQRAAITHELVQLDGSDKMIKVLDPFPSTELISSSR